MRPLAHPEDVRSLTEGQRRSVVALLLQLERDPEHGKPLAPLKSHQVHRGSLSSCRVATVPGPYELELRVIYRVPQDGGGIDVVAIGPRMRSQCYQLADKRLNPPPRRVMHR